MHRGEQCFSVPGSAGSPGQEAQSQGLLVSCSCGRYRYFGHTRRAINNDQGIYRVRVFRGYVYLHGIRVSFQEI